jgi:hypothetical protein
VSIVTANVEEAFNKVDVANSVDVDVFIRRVTTVLPNLPDVLLLQEVRGSVADYIARQLTKKSGARFVVARGPGPVHLRETSKRLIKKETAILLNLETMRKVDSGGLVSTSYTKAQSAPGKLPEVKHHAYVLAEEKATGMRIPLASVHFSPQGNLANKTVGQKLRKKWSLKVADVLERKYHKGTPPYLSSIGGDFNAGRCWEPGGKCKVSSFFAALTSDRWGYRDAVRAIVEAPGVDYIFTRGGVHDGGTDPGYDPKAAAGDRSAYYSDHPFRWMILGPDVTPPSAPTDISAASPNERHVGLKWTPPADAGESGIGGYEVWRRGSTGEWRLMGRQQQAAFLDDTTFGSVAYTYYVRAFDGAHNLSAPSETVSIRPEND